MSSLTGALARRADEHTHTEGRSREDAGSRQPSASQGEGFQEELALPTLLPRTSSVQTVKQ